MADREGMRTLAGGVYPLGLLLFLLPLLDVAMRVSPFRHDAADWRFAALGMLFGSLGTVLIGLTVLAFVAAYRGNAILLRVLSVLSILAGLLVLALLALFVLDALQVRQMAAEQLRRPIMTSSISAAAAGALAALTLLSVGAGAWGASRAIRTASRRTSSRPPAPNPMVVQATTTSSGGGAGRAK